MRVLTLVLIALVGCASQPGPIEIPADELPFSVRRAEPPAATPLAERVYRIYFVREGRLHEVRREIETEGDPRAEVLRVLFEGPDVAEKDRGVGTEIPREVRLLGVDTGAGDGLVRVDLSGEFQQPAVPESITLRVAQVVWTLTAFADVRSISLAIDGEPVSVTTDQGDAVEGRVSRDDYTKVSPP